MSAHLPPIYALAVDRATAEHLVELIDLFNDADAPAHDRIAAADEVMRILGGERAARGS